MKRWLSMALFSLAAVCGCSSQMGKPDTIVATYKFSDAATGNVIYDILKQHGIWSIGWSNGGWVEVIVHPEQAVEGRNILTSLTNSERSLKVVER